jgi:transposase
MAYSEDLRDSAVKYFLSHDLQYKEAAAIFGIGSGTLHRWVASYQNDGRLEYKTSTGRPRALSLEQESAFKDMVMANYDQNLEQLSEIWEAQSGQRMSIFSVSRSIRRLGFTRKKRPSGRVNGIKPC